MPFLGSYGAPSGGVAGTDLVPISRGGQVYDVPASTIAGLANTSGVVIGPSIVGKNRLINGGFYVSQRGAGPFTSAGYTADRWAISSSTGGSRSVASLVALSDADRTAIGTEYPTYGLTYTVTGDAGANGFDLLQQRIEGVRSLSGKQVTFSVWAKATAACGIALEFAQQFGSGSAGSPVYGIGSKLISIGTTWTQATMTTTLPSASGQTFGTPYTDFTAANIWVSSSTGQATRSASLPTQNAVITLACAQVEYGTAATAFEERLPALDLLLCQRYFEVVQIVSAGYANAAGQQVIASNPFQVAKRVTPSFATTLTSVVNIGTATPTAFGDNQGFLVTASASAQGAYSFNQQYQASAEL